MDDYVIGSGALLTAGPNASIAAATLHAQTERGLAPAVRAALFDFESSVPSDLSRIVVVAAGWNARRFDTEVSTPLVNRGRNTLADILALLAAAVGTAELHVFARWFPDDVLVAALRRADVTLIAHPLETVRQAALISGQAYRRWTPPLRAA